MPNTKLLDMCSDYCIMHNNIHLISNYNTEILNIH